MSWRGSDQTTRVELAHKLVALPKPRPDLTRRSEIQDLTTRTDCESLHAWLREISALGAQWTTDSTWEFVRSVLSEPGDDPLLLACQHLFALGGPYTADSRPSKQIGRRLGELDGIAAALKGSDVDVDEIFRSRSMVRREFVAPLVGSVLGKAYSGREIDERRPAEYLRDLSVPLQVLASALATELDRVSGSMTSDGWRSLIRKDTSSKQFEEVDGKIGRGLHGVTGVEEIHPALRGRAYQSVEYLFTINRVIEDVLAAVLARRRSVRLASELRQQGELGRRVGAALADILVSDEHCMEAFLQFNRMCAALVCLQDSFDGRILLRACGIEGDEFVAHWAAGLPEALMIPKLLREHADALWTDSLERICRSPRGYDLFGVVRALWNGDMSAELIDETERPIADWDILLTMWWFADKLTTVFPDDGPQRNAVRLTADIAVLEHAALASRAAGVSGPDLGVLITPFLRDEFFKSGD